MGPVAKPARHGHTPALDHSMGVTFGDFFKAITAGKNTLFSSPLLGSISSLFPYPAPLPATVVIPGCLEGEGNPRAALALLQSGSVGRWLQCGSSISSGRKD